MKGTNVSIPAMINKVREKDPDKAKSCTTRYLKSKKQTFGKKRMSELSIIMVI